MVTLNDNDLAHQSTPIDGSNNKNNVILFLGYSVVHMNQKVLSTMPTCLFWVTDVIDKIEAQSIAT